MPTATDLVTDLPADFEVFGQAVATSMADLLGGTSGQVLAKNSNTDMDFVWVTSDDANAIQNTIVDAKGDLIAASAADTPARLAVGNNGETLVADSSTSTGLRYQGHIEAGKNFIINGGFDIWQRGTSFSVPAFNFPYTADRWTTFNGNAMTISQETTTVPTGANYALKVTGGATTSGYEVEQGIESVNAIRLAGKTVTASILATGTTGVTHSITVQYSTSVDPNAATGSWTGISPAGSATVTSGTFSQIKTTVAIPSTAKSLRFLITVGSLTSGQTAIFGNAQLELGSVPTEFSRAGGTIQGELAACQRYYWRFTVPTAYANLAPSAGIGVSSTVARFAFLPPVPMRTTPTSLDYSLLILYDTSATPAVTSAAHSAYTTASVMGIDFTVGSGLTQYRPYQVLSSNSTAAYLGASAEL